MTVAMTHSDYVQLLDDNEIIDYCVNEYKFYVNYHNQMKSILTDKEPKIKSPMDYLDNRKGLLTIFYYCPYTGEKIDWKKIKKQLKEYVK